MRVESGEVRREYSGKFLTLPIGVFFCYAAVMQTPQSKSSDLREAGSPGFGHMQAASMMWGRSEGNIPESSYIGKTEKNMI